MFSVQCASLLLSFLRGLLNADYSMLRKIAIHNTSITEVAWVEEGTMQGWNILRVSMSVNPFCRRLEPFWQTHFPGRHSSH